MPFHRCAIPPMCHSTYVPFLLCAIPFPKFCHSAILPFCHSSKMPFRHSAILLFHQFAITPIYLHLYTISTLTNVRQCMGILNSPKTLTAGRSGAVKQWRWGFLWRSEKFLEYVLGHVHLWFNRAKSSGTLCKGVTEQHNTFDDLILNFEQSHHVDNHKNNRCTLGEMLTYYSKNQDDILDYECINCNQRMQRHNNIAYVVIPRTYASFYAAIDMTETQEH